MNIECIIIQKEVNLHFLNQQAVKKKEAIPGLLLEYSYTELINVRSENLFKAVSVLLHPSHLFSGFY